jgi:photosystem II stability/assembly factor-like uncharacterized protein
MTLDRTVPARLGRAAMLAALLLVAGCSSKTSTPVAPPVLIPLSALVVTPHTDTLTVGGNAQIIATCYDTLGAVVGNVAITWTSSNNAVCTVSTNGVVTGRGEGSAWVRAESSGKRDSTNVFVRSGTGWELQTSGAFGANLGGVHFRPDGRQGWAVGAGGRIVHTTDAGVTWSPQTSGTTFNLNRVWFTSDLDGVAVGNSGTVMTTADGGQTWTRNSTVTTAEILYDVKFFDASNGWAVGANGVTLRTTDGGANWSRTVLAAGTALRGVAFSSALDGWTVGDGGKVYGTHDGGVSWYPVSVSTTQSLRGVWSYDASHVLAVGQQGTVAMALAGPDSVVWSVPSPNAGASNQLQQCILVSPTVGYAVGINSGLGSVLRTDDGGFTWQPQVANTTVQLNDVYFVDSQRGWAVGNGGIIIHTSTAGF